MSTPERSLWPRIVILGDSITQMCFGYDGGWGAMLNDSLQRRCDVISRGFGGYNTRHCKTVIRAVTPKSLEAELAVIFLGANDATGTVNSSQHVPLDEFKANIADISSYLRDQVGIPEILLVTPPPSDDTAMDQALLDGGRSSALTAEYATACREEGEALGLPTLDTHTLFMEQVNWQSFLRDGLHFNRSGSEFFHGILDPRVRELINIYMPSNMGPNDPILPNYDQVSNTFPCQEIEQWAEDHPVVEGKKMKKGSQKE